MTATRDRTERRKKLVAEVREMRAHGAKFADIAAALGISPSYAQQLYDDPEGEKARRRKDGYAGTCRRCGNPTSGSNGPSQAPSLCHTCNVKLSLETRIWNRDNVIKAIQAWAAEHGRPPLAYDWMRSGETESGVPYPNFSTVYRSAGGRHAPFASWADAVEAAGFRRPHQGHKTKGSGNTTYWGRMRAKMERQHWREKLEDQEET